MKKQLLLIVALLASISLAYGLDIDFNKTNNFKDVPFAGLKVGDTFTISNIDPKVFSPGELKDAMGTIWAKKLSAVYPYGGKTTPGRGTATFKVTAIPQAAAPIVKPPVPERPSKLPPQPTEVEPIPLLPVPERPFKLPPQPTEVEPIPLLPPPVPERPFKLPPQPKEVEPIRVPPVKLPGAAEVPAAAKAREARIKKALEDAAKLAKESVFAKAVVDADVNKVKELLSVATTDEIRGLMKFVDIFIVASPDPSKQSAYEEIKKLLNKTLLDRETADAEAIAALKRMGKKIGAAVLKNDVEAVKQLLSTASDNEIKDLQQFAKRRNYDQIAKLLEDELERREAAKKAGGKDPFEAAVEANNIAQVEKLLPSKELKDIIAQRELLDIDISTGIKTDEFKAMLDLLDQELEKRFKAAVDANNIKEVTKLLSSIELKDIKAQRELLDLDISTGIKTDEFKAMLKALDDELTKRAKKGAAEKSAETVKESPLKLAVDSGDVNKIKSELLKATFQQIADLEPKIWVAAVNAKGTAKQQELAAIYKLFEQELEKRSKK